MWQCVANCVRVHRCKDPSTVQDPAKQKAAIQSLSEQVKQKSVPVNNPIRPGSLQVPARA